MKKLFISFLVLIFVFPFFLKLVDFEARENDSRLYIGFVQQLAEKPLSEIIALEWRSNTPFADPTNPYVRDHLIGQFIPSVILTKIGWDGRYSHYLVNQIYRLFIPFLMFAFFARYFSKESSILILLALQLNTIALNYGLRANQEQALMFSLVFVMASYFSFQVKRDYLSFYGMGLFGFLVKGLSGLIQYPFWVLHALLTKDQTLKKRRFFNLVGLGVLCLIVSGIYEVWFRKVTGFSFWEAYFRIQIFGRGKSTGIPFKSLLYYVPRAIGYSLPWALGVYFLIKKKSEFTDEQQDFLRFILWNIIGYLLIFGFFARNASRYIFPVYYLIGSLGALGFGLHFKEKLKSVNKFGAENLHLILFWAILIAQCCLFLYKGKTFDGA